MKATIWRLKHPARVEIRCVVVPSENESWELTVQQGNQIIHTEHHHDIDAALLRANAMWIEYQLDGWTEV